MGAYSIGVDLGGTNLRAAAVDENGQMLEIYKPKWQMAQPLFQWIQERREVSDQDFEKQRELRKVMEA